MRRIVAFLLYFFAGLAFLKEGLAQAVQREVKFKHLAENPQLSNPDINTIAQDARGFLWVGTNDGLNRFDGYTFKIYRNSKNDTLSLNDNGIHSVFEDSQGTLWVITFNSTLHYYKRAADVFYRYPKISSKPYKLRTIMEDSNHDIWIGGKFDSQAFVAKLDRTKDAWKIFSLFPSAEGIYTILQYSENEFLFGTRVEGLYKWNKETNALKHYLHDKNTNSIPGNSTEALAKDTDGNIWIGTNDSGLCKFNIDNNVYKNFNALLNTDKNTIPSNAITDLCMDGQYLWVASENGGLTRINTKTNELTNYLYNQSDPNSIINNSISSLYKDHQGRIWIGSFSKGLCVLDVLDEKFQVLKIPFENDLVNAIYKDSKGRTWIGTEDGLWLQDNAVLRHFRFDPKNDKSISSNAVLTIYEDHKNRIWIGLWKGGINRFEENSKTFIRYSPNPNQKGGLTNSNVFSILESSQTGELLVGTFGGGLNILKDESTGIFESPFKYPTGEDQVIYAMLEDSKKNLWVGAVGGLSLYSLEKRSIKPIPIYVDTTRMYDRINCILEDHNGSIWIGSNGGLHHMISQNKFITYTVNDGMPVNIVRDILEDSKGNLWLGTTKGLTFFNPVTKVFKTYNESDGLLSVEFRRRSFFKAKDGEMFIGCKGVNTFFPERITGNPYQPTVYITDLKIFNKSIKPSVNDGILKEDIATTKEIYLNQAHLFFSLHYVGLNFTQSNKNQYAYKLENFDKDWVDVGTQRFATFTNLDPGTYTFKVKASNNDGLWNEEGASLIIHVLPPWWKTWWFRTTLLFALTGMVILIFILRTRSIRRTNRNLEETVNQKTELIKEQNKMLIQQSEELAAQNEELVQSQEEIASQRDLVSKHNELLEKEVVKRTQELVEYNQQLEQFAFISAHNLRAPVARILGLGQLLGLAKNNHDEKDDIYPKLIHTAHELDGVVRDLNVILELKRNNNTFITEVDLTVTSAMILQNLEKEIALTHATITTDFSRVNILRTVKPYIDSILFNLINNAIKYRHPDRPPVVHIKTEVLQNEVCLTVTDNGLGVDLSLFREKIFTLYTRFHHHVEGKGMGLYLVKTQMTAMGGRIEVESEVGKGTTFKAYFKS